MLLIRSLIFQFYFFASVAIAGPLIAALFWLPYSVRLSVTRAWCKGMLWAGESICGLRYQLEGVENIPDEPSVIMIKHSTIFEVYAPLVFFPPQSWVIKREILWIPLFGWAVGSLRPIAINRKAGATAVTQVIEKGKERLAGGLHVVVFPEGTRVKPGHTKKYGVSGAALAKEAGVKIVPVAHNAGDLWARRGIIKNPGLIRFVIGPPIDASERKPKETNKIVQDWIESKMAEISPDAYAAASSERESPAAGAD